MHIYANSYWFMYNRPSLRSMIKKLQITKWSLHYNESTKNFDYIIQIERMKELVSNVLKVRLLKDSSVMDSSLMKKKIKTNGKQRVSPYDKILISDWLTYYTRVFWICWKKKQGKRDGYQWSLKLNYMVKVRLQEKFNLKEETW